VTLVAWASDDQDRRLLRDLATRAPRRRIYGHCHFCGALCWGRVCRAHRDLLEVEAEPDAPHREVSAPGSDEEGA
jgi:hypothetical protein